MNNISLFILGILLTANIGLLGHVGGQVYENSIAITRMQENRFTNDQGEELTSLIQKLTAKIDLQYLEINQRLDILEKNKK